MKIIVNLDNVTSAGCGSYSACINRIDRTTRGNTQWSIEGASRWVSIISSTATTGKGRELGPSLIRSGP